MIKSPAADITALRKPACRQAGWTEEQCHSTTVILMIFCNLPYKNSSYPEGIPLGRPGRLQEF